MVSVNMNKKSLTDAKVSARQQCVIVNPGGIDWDQNKRPWPL